MKRTLEIVLAGLLVAGLATGCPGKSDDGNQETSATTETATSEEAATTEEAETTPEADAAAAAVEVDEPLYIKAAYEVTCVKTKVEDPEEQKIILAEIYPRYGFEDAEAFAAAEAAMMDKESVKLAIEEKLKTCTVELAKGFKEAGATEEAAAEKTAEKTEKKAAPKMGYEPGTYKGSVAGGGITDGSISITARDDGKATGIFKGQREGKNFILAMKGEIAKDGSFRIKGSKGKNMALASGNVKGDKVNGKIDGTINQKKFSVAFSAK